MFRTRGWSLLVPLFGFGTWGGSEFQGLGVSESKGHTHTLWCLGFEWGLRVQGFGCLGLFLGVFRWVEG